MSDQERPSIAVFMMQKDETSLLSQWISYHSALFGSSNLYIFDNGSSDQGLGSILDKFERDGGHLLKKYVSPDDYRNRSLIYLECVKELDLEGRYSHYIFLDCDEFIALKKEELAYTCDRNEILSYIRQFAGEPRVLRVCESLWNVLGRPDFYWPRTYSKTIFPRFGFTASDHGFHCAESERAPGEVRTSLVYVHFHFKPFDEQLRCSARKLEAHQVDLSIIDRHTYRGTSFHLVEYFNESPEKYYSRIHWPGAIPFRDMRVALEELGENLPFGAFVIGDEPAS